MSERKARWGVIGCAGIAYNCMLPALLKAKNSELYALASRTQEKLDRFSEKFHPQKGYLSYDELLDDPMVDVVYIPLPNALHYEWIIKACEKGKPVLCEKPLTMNHEQAQKVYEVSKKTGVPVMEAFAFFHGPVYKKLREILDKGDLGKIRCIEANFTQVMRDTNNVRLIKDIGGGACYDMGCYLVSFARALAGEEPDDVHVIRTIGDTGVDIDVLASLHFPSGIKASLYTSLDAHWSTRNTVFCEYGQIDISSMFDPLDLKNKKITVITKDPRHQGKGSIQEINIDNSLTYTLQMEQMAEVALGRAVPALPLSFTVGTAKVMDKLIGIE